MKPVLRRRTYPSSVARWRRDGLFCAGVVTMAAGRRVADALRSPGTLIVTVLGLALLMLSIRPRTFAPASRDADWLLVAVVGLLTVIGVRTWWRHLAQRLEDSTWVVLGGHPGALGIGLLASQSVIASLLLGGTVRAVGASSQFSITFAWWSAAMTFWLCLCLGIGALLKRANRREAWWSVRGLATGSVCAGGAVTLISGLMSGRYPPEGLAAGGFVLATVAGGGLVPGFVMHERVRLGFEDRDAPDEPAERGLDGWRCRFVGVRRIAARLVMRTLFPELVQALAFAAGVGIVTAGVLRLEGVPQAALMSGGFLIMIVVGLGVRFRSSVGQQHLFLFLHRPSPDVGVWRGIAQGECFTFAVVAAGVYVLLMFLAWPLETPAWVLLPVAVEWAVYVALAAHLLSPGTRGDDSARPLMLAVAAGVMLVIALIKAVVAGYLLTTWVIPFQCAACAVGAVLRVAHVPYYVNGPKSPFGPPSTQWRRS